MIVRVAFALYAACVDFMLQTARLLGLTYRDTNALMFFVLWPAVTALLAAIVVRQRLALRRLRRARGAPSERRAHHAGPAAPPVAGGGPPS